MVEPQLSTDRLKLSEEMPPGSWPWISAVDANIDPKVYGYNVCGPIVYEVYLVDNGLNPTSLVTLTGSSTDTLTLIFAP
jgi:hypothetical protein